MKAINLYVFTRCLDFEGFSLFERKMSCRDEKLKQIKSDELVAIKLLVAKLINAGATLDQLDNWFYSFSIPQISKEFDLLLIDKERKVINIELKSQRVDEDRIEKQLIQNRYYLSNIADEVKSYSFVRLSDEKYELYRYENILEMADIEMLLSDISLINNPIEDNVEELFCPKDYLISPINTPDKFLDGKYFLTNQQAEIKRRICEGYQSKKKMYGISGAAGTGKSLLLYDVAKEFGKEETPTCIIHCGKLADGHRQLSRKINGVDIFPAKGINMEVLNRYKYIFVDETQRLYKSTLDTILESFAVRDYAVFVFAYDFAQVLSKKEKRRNNPQRLRNVDGFEEKTLSVRIRSNREIFTFIRNMMTLSDTPKEKMEYKNIDIAYANTLDEVNQLLRYFKSKGYVFITLTPSQFVRNNIDKFAGNINSHDVVGQEFDKVVVVLDENFRYEDGMLHAREHPNPDYLFANLFYQNITRAKEKLALVVYDNRQIFESILTIV